jgi:hypothetical protein
MQMIKKKKAKVDLQAAEGRLQESQRTPEYQEDIKRAIDAIRQGAEARKVYQRIARKYPKLSTELKRILLARDPDKALMEFTTPGGGTMKVY